MNLSASVLMLTLFRRREFVDFAIRVAAIFAPAQPALVRP
jgi:hypothetical protein